MNRIPNLCKLVLPFCLFCLASTSSFADVIVRLEIEVDTTNQSWQSYLRIDDAFGETLGLAGIEFSVAGTEGLTVTGSSLRLPVATETSDFTTYFQKGFKNFRSDGINGTGMRAAQDVFNTLSNAGTGHNSIIEGIGKVDAIEVNGSLPTTATSAKVLIGSGTYTGSAGLLTVAGSPQLTTLLPAALPNLGNPITTFSPQAVINGSVRIFAVPEPTSIVFAPLWAFVFSFVRFRRQSSCG